MLSRRITAALVALALILGTQWSALAVTAAPRAADEQCFPETNQCIREPYLSYWRDHGGLAINGYPISEPFSQKLEDGKSYTVQYFERVRMEEHPENADPQFRVLLGQFGRLLYPIDPANPLATSVPALPGATYFNATGHNLNGKFRTYWQAHGGLPQFGYPISEELREVLEDGKEYTVQYFERARFELHPEYANTEYDVLLGQFGRRVLGALNPNPTLPYIVSGNRGALYRNDFGARVRLVLPTGAEYLTDGVIQGFERGAMIWRKDQRKIYVIAKDQGNYQQLGNWQGYDDTWEEGQNPGGGPAPVPNLYFPKRGFGKVWRDHPEVQQLLGYALTNDEAPKTLVLQEFVGGLMVDVRNAPNTNDYRNSPGIYLLYTNHRFEFRYSYGP